MEFTLIPEISKHHSKGIALTFVVIVLFMLMILASIAGNVFVNQRMIQNQYGGQRIANYYAARAGLVEAMWRIRTNWTGAGESGVVMTGAPGGGFNDAAWDPAPYTINVNPRDADLTDTEPTSLFASGQPQIETGIQNVRIDISLPDANGVRTITATGLDS